MKKRFDHDGGFAEVWMVGETAVLNMLYVPPNLRGRGIASQLLKEVLEEADRENRPVGLQVAGDIDGDNALTDEQLIAWYGRKGFVHDDRFVNRGRLIRRPHTAAEQEKR